MGALASRRQRALPDKSDKQVYSSEPVSDYWQALHRVAVHFELRQYPISADPLPFEVLLLADIFWVKPQSVQADLEKIRRALA